MSISGLPSPHGGQLVRRIDKNFDYSDLDTQIPLDMTSLCDLELLAIGAYSPLTGFMKQKDYESVLSSMRLVNGLVWSIPITLPVSSETAAALQPGLKAKLVYQNTVYGVIEIHEIYSPDKSLEAKMVYQTKDTSHPGVQSFFKRQKIYIAGPITLIRSFNHPLYKEHSFDPMVTRKEIQRRKWNTIVGFQTRNPIHRAHEYILKAALETNDGLLIHPLVGETKSDDIPADIRLESYQALITNYFPENTVCLAVFPAAMRYAGPREAVFHTIVRKNYGCTHIIIGRDHAGVGNYYGAYDAQDMLKKFSLHELGITPIFFEHSFYCYQCKHICSTKTCPHEEEQHLVLSGTKVRQMIKKGERPPGEFSRPEVIEVLMRDRNPH